MTCARHAAALAAALVLALACGTPSASAQSVLQHHNSATRQGFYTSSGLAKADVSKTARVSTINTVLNGAVYAQLLYYSHKGVDVVIAATETNHVTAVNVVTGRVVFDKVLAPPMISAKLPCGNIDPTTGITGTPVIDDASHSMYVGGMSTPDGGVTTRQLIWRVSATTGTIFKGWPVDVTAVLKAKYNIQFTSNVQNQRGALLILKGRVYVPYGGLAGDCGDYHGYVVSVSLTNSADVTYYRTSGMKGGIWTPGGVSSDGTDLFVATGNTFDAPYWQEGNAVLRLKPGPAFRNVSADFFTPAQWQQYDIQDIDLCGTNPMIFDYPKGTRLVAEFGKDGIGYLLNRSNLNGHQGPIFSKKLASSVIITAPAIYKAANGGTYIVFKGSGLMCPSGSSGDVMAVRMKNTKPSPSFDVAWCATQGGAGSPMVTAASATTGSKATVWSASSDAASNQLHAFDGATGRQLWASAALGTVARFHAPIMAKGKVYIASSSGLHAFYIGGHTAWSKAF